jgi:(heptosyl)LPS beta-1,4-glucosyltransferase
MGELTGLVITYNEARNIGACLDALRQVADEIIVVDSFSTDSTAAICSRYPSVKFYQHAWQGFGPQKNFGASQASFDHILSIDADEVLSEQLVLSILEEKKKGFQGYYLLQRLNYYYGKFLRFGVEYPDHKPRLYNRKFVHWNQSKVHEELLIPGDQEGKLLSGHLKHFTYLTIEEHAGKQNKYTSLAAADLIAAGKQPSLVKILFSPMVSFIKAYFLKKGFMDGRHGLILAIMHANGTFQKYSKHWQLYYYPTEKQSTR